MAAAAAEAAVEAKAADANEIDIPDNPVGSGSCRGGDHRRTDCRGRTDGRGRPRCGSDSLLCRPGFRVHNARQCSDQRLPSAR
jgi:hypothetical protein